MDSKAVAQGIAGTGTGTGFRLVEMLGPSGVGKSTALAMMLAKGPEGVIDRAALAPELPRKAPQQLDSPALRPVLDLVFHILARAPGEPSRRMAALDMCRTSFQSRMTMTEPGGQMAKALHGKTLIHDELALHRAFSILPFSASRLRDARAFFSAVPLPDRAVICIADPAQVLTRIAGRGPLPNCYRGLDPEALEALLHELVDCSLLAHDCLIRRGADCRVLRFDAGPEEAARDLARACLDEGPK